MEKHFLLGTPLEPFADSLRQALDAEADAAHWKRFLLALEKGATGLIEYEEATVDADDGYYCSDYDDSGDLHGYCGGEVNNDDVLGNTTSPWAR